jgi:hypothetical protein
VKTIVIWKETYVLLVKARGTMEHKDGMKRTMNETVKELALSVLQH